MILPRVFFSILGIQLGEASKDALLFFYHYMKDLNGELLEIGDYVVYTSYDRAALSLGRIVNISKSGKSVKLVTGFSWITNKSEQYVCKINVTTRTDTINNIDKSYEKFFEN